MLTIYDSAYATCPRKARFALEAKGVDYQRQEIELLEPGAKGEGSRIHALNQKGVLPVLEHDGHLLTESTVICEYVDERFDGPPLMPSDPFERARTRLWMKRIEVEVHEPHHVALNFAVTFRHVVSSWSPEDIDGYLAGSQPRRREVLSDVLENGLQSRRFVEPIVAYDEFIADLDGELADRSWIAGRRFSLAEVGVAPWLLRLKELGFDDLLWAERPKVGDWLGRVEERDDFQRAMHPSHDARIIGAMAERGAEAVPAATAALDR